MDPKYIKLSILPFNISFRAKMLTDTNPHLCRMLWETLPYQSILTHTMVSGGNIYSITPIGNTFEMDISSFMNRIKAPVGTIFLSDPQTLFIKYKDVSEPNDYPAVAKIIDKDIPKLLEAGELCWQSLYRTKEIITIKIFKDLPQLKDQCEKNVFILKDIENVKDEKIKNTIYKINENIDLIWLTPPKELLDMFNGLSTNKPGTNNQYFSTILFSTSTLQQLAGLGITATITNMAQKDDIIFEQLVQFTKHSLPLHFFDFLGYCGLKKFADISYEVLQCIEIVDSKHELFILMSSYAIYCNKMHLWCLHYFPWHHGSNHMYSSNKLQGDFV